jgi:hypothetical protein
MKQTIKLRESELRRMISESVEDAWREIKFGNFEDDDEDEEITPYDEFEEIESPRLTRKPHKMYKFTESKINRIVKECVRRVLNEGDGLVHFHGMSFEPEIWAKHGDYIKKCVEEGWSEDEIAHLFYSNAQKGNEFSWIDDADF